MTVGAGDPVVVTPEALAGLGVDLGTFELATVMRSISAGAVEFPDGGIGGEVVATVVGTDRVGIPQRVRLVVLELVRGVPGRQRARSVSFEVRATHLTLPFEAVYQVVFSPRACRALVIGERGSRLCIADLRSGRVVPDGGLALPPLGLRASGVAGFEARRVEKAGEPRGSGREAGLGGSFWFSAYRVDGDGAAHEHRLWRVTERGIEPGLSLERIAADLGAIRSHCFVGAGEGFVAVTGPGGGEELWHVGEARSTPIEPDSAPGRLEDGSEPAYALVAEAEAFGGLAAQPGRVACSSAGADGSFVVPAAVVGTEQVLAPDRPLFYPFLSPDGALAVVATLSLGTESIDYVAASPTSGVAEPLLSAYPGQGKIGDGVFAHYGPDGVSVCLQVGILADRSDGR